jgi:hypothetical protein
MLRGYLKRARKYDIKICKGYFELKNPTMAHLGNKPSKNELSFILTCKMEIFEPRKIKTGAATL